MNLLIEADQKYLEDAKRAAEIAEEIAGPMAGTLPILLELVSAVHGYTHRKRTMDYWAAGLGRFGSTYPVVEPDATRADLDRLVEAANRVTKAWAAAEPKLATRAVHLVAWSGAIQMLGEIHGPGATEAFVRMTKEWAAVWDSTAVKS